MISDDGFVWVRRQWDGTPAKYLRDDFQSPHWGQDSGGRGGGHPRYFIFGYIMCDGSNDGEIEHSDFHGPCPHRIKVCVVDKDNTSLTMTVLRVGARIQPPEPAMAADRVLTALEDAGGQLLNTELWTQAKLSKARGNEVLGRLVGNGEIESVDVIAPNVAGRRQHQVAWRLANKPSDEGRLPD
jgi:hypothetical protein